MRMRVSGENSGGSKFRAKFVTPFFEKKKVATSKLFGKSFSGFKMQYLHTLFPENTLDGGIGKFIGYVFVKYVSNKTSNSAQIVG